MREQMSRLEMARRVELTRRVAGWFSRFHPDLLAPLVFEVDSDVGCSACGGRFPSWGFRWSRGGEPVCPLCGSGYMHFVDGGDL